MKEVYVAKSPSEAHFVRFLLESEGILAQVQGEAAHGLRGEVPMTFDTLPSVWVLNDAEKDRALEIILAYEKKQKEKGTLQRMWKCTDCGEMNPESFECCWKCNTESTGVYLEEETDGENDETTTVPEDITERTMFLGCSGCMLIGVGAVLFLAGAGLGYLMFATDEAPTERNSNNDGVVDESTSGSASTISGARSSGRR